MKNDEKVISIAGLDPKDVFMVLYNNARPIPGHDLMTSEFQFNGEITDEEIARIVAHRETCLIGFVRSKMFEVKLVDPLDLTMYRAHNGYNSFHQAKAAIENLHRIKEQNAVPRELTGKDILQKLQDSLDACTLSIKHYPFSLFDREADAGSTLKTQKELRAEIDTFVEFQKTRLSVIAIALNDLKSDLVTLGPRNLSSAEYDELKAECLLLKSNIGKVDQFLMSITTRMTEAIKYNFNNE